MSFLKRISYKPLMAIIASTALLTACGGGGGGGDVRAGLINKIQIVSPANGADVIDKSSVVRLNWLVGDSRDSLQVNLNGKDVTAFFNKASQNPQASIFNLQGLVNEGANTLSIAVSGGHPVRSSFNADISKPELIISEVVAESCDSSITPPPPSCYERSISGSVRKSFIEMLTFESSGVSSVTPYAVSGDSQKFKSYDVILANTSADTKDELADIALLTTDKSAALASFPVGSESDPAVEQLNGNKNTQYFSKPGRELYAASALQMNNKGFTEIGKVIASIVDGLADTVTTDTLVVNAAAASELNLCIRLILLFKENGGSKAPAKCQVFIQGKSLDNNGNVINKGIEIEKDDINVGVQVSSSSSSTSNEAPIRFDVGVKKVEFTAIIKAYADDAAVIAGTSQATVTMPLKASWTENPDPNDPTKTIANSAIVMQADLENILGNLFFSLRPYGVGFSNTVGLDKGKLEPLTDGSCFDDNTGDAFECAATTILTAPTLETILNQAYNGDGTPANPGITDAQLQEAALAIDERISVALFAGDKTKRNLNLISRTVTPRKTLLEKIGDSSVKYGTVVNTAKFAKVHGVTGNIGAYFQLAASSEATDEGRSAAVSLPVGFLASNNVLGAAFNPVDYSGDHEFKKQQLINGDSAASIAVSVNAINQGLLNVFQFRAIDNESVANKKISDLLTTEQLSLLSTAKNLCGASEADIQANDDISFKLAMTSVPYITLGSKDNNAFAQLHINGLEVSVDIKRKDASGTPKDIPGVVNPSGSTSELDMELDLVAQLNFGLNSESLPELSLLVSENAVSIYNLKSVADAILSKVKNNPLCSGIAGSFTNPLTEAALIGLVPSLLGSTVDQIQTTLIKENVLTINIPNIDIAEQRIEMIAKDFTVNTANDLLEISVDICESSACPAGQKGIASVIIRKEP